MRRFAVVAVLAGLCGCGGGPEDRTAALVACFERAGGTVVERPQIPQPSSSRATPPADVVRRAQRGEPTGAQQLVVMPPSAEWTDPLDDCAEEVAREQIVP